MRKCNRKMVERGGGRSSRQEDGTVKYDRTNFPQTFGHQMANNKRFQLAANELLRKLISPFIPEQPAVEIPA